MYVFLFMIQLFICEGIYFHESRKNLPGICRRMRLANENGGAGSLADRHSVICFYRRDLSCFGNKDSHSPIDNCWYMESSLFYKSYCFMTILFFLAASCMPFCTNGCFSMFTKLCFFYEYTKNRQVNLGDFDAIT